MSHNIDPQHDADDVCRKYPYSIHPIVFDDLAPIEVPVKLEGLHYVLREASGDAVVKYQNRIFKSTKIGGEGKPTTIEGFADADPYLLSMCLFEADENGLIKLDKHGRASSVQVQTILSWPNRVLARLVSTLKQISPDIEGKETEESLTKKISLFQEKLDNLRSGRTEQQAKNSETATTDGSV
jgi:hypothetical protein